MHHRIMKVRIEFLSQGLDLLDACVFQRLHKLSIYFIHSVYKRIVYLSVFNALEPSLEIIDNRQDLLNDVLCSTLIHGRFLLFSTLSVIVKHRHLACQLIGQIFDLLILWILFILSFKESFLFFAVVRSFLAVCAFRRAGLFRFILCGFILYRNLTVLLSLLFRFFYGLFYHFFLILTFSHQDTTFLLLLYSFL